MSHYTVAVIHKAEDSLENMLAPYSEHLQVEPYISITVEELLKEYDKLLEEKEEKIKKLKEKNRRDAIEFYKNITAEKTREERLKIMYDYYGADDENIENGNIMSTYNPISKWDWWELGGRWNGMLRVKEITPDMKSGTPGIFGNRYLEEEYESGMHCDEAPLDLVDFAIDEDARREAERWWDVAIEGAPLEKGERSEDFETFYKTEYYKEKYHDREHFVKVRAGVHTYAILTPEGEWLEPGEMGWWGISNASAEQEFEFIDNYEKIIDEYRNQGYILSIVDCHI